MRRALVFGAVLAIAPALPAHVTPNVQLVKRGEFIKSSLPGAVKFFEKQLMIGGPDMAAIEKATDWIPSEEDARMYVGKDAEGRPAGAAVFVWVPSEHGPVGIGVAFDAAGKVVRADVTDIGTEPLAWIRPLLSAGGMAAFAGLPADRAPDPAKVAPSVTGKINRYYAEVISRGVARAQALERVSLRTPAGQP
jgi:hypothetical protein